MKWQFENCEIKRQEIKGDNFFPAVFHHSIGNWGVNQEIICSIALFELGTRVVRGSGSKSRVRVRFGYQKSRVSPRGGTTRLGNSTRLESTHVSSFNSSLTRLVHQLENSQLDSTRFLISKIDNSKSDSNANTLPKILKFTIYKMKYASLFFLFSYFLQVLMIFFSCDLVPLHAESSTFKNHQKIAQK